MTLQLGTNNQLNTLVLIILWAGLVSYFMGQIMPGVFFHRIPIIITYL